MTISKYLDDFHRYAYGSMFHLVDGVTVVTTDSGDTEMWACTKCGAYVANFSLITHFNWHEGNHET